MVKVYSSGSALDEGPGLYLSSPAQHGHGAEFREVASFSPFDGASGARVATSSTTSGANLLVSGFTLQDREARVQKYEFVRSKERTNMLEAVPLREVGAIGGLQPVLLGGQ